VNNPIISFIYVLLVKLANTKLLKLHTSKI
jgi:hypothetical protein